MENFQDLLSSEILDDLLGGPPENSSEQRLIKMGSIRLRSNLSGDKAKLTMGYMLSVGFVVRALSATDRRRYDAVLSSLSFLHSISLASDGICNLIADQLSSDNLSLIMDYDMFLDKDLSVVFHDLLLSLMADQSFKMVAAVAYTKSFKKLCTDYCNGQGKAGASMFSLSVQFLNREVFVHEICYHHQYLDEATSKLFELIEQISVPSNSSTSINAFLLKPFLKYRRYSCIVGDLKVHKVFLRLFFLTHSDTCVGLLQVIGAIPDISRFFMTKNLHKWLDILECCQQLHLQKRIRTTHVLFEDSTWMIAFNLTLGFSSLFDFFCNWFFQSDSNVAVLVHSQSSMKAHSVEHLHASVADVLTMVYQRVIQWQRVSCHEEYQWADHFLSSPTAETRQTSLISMKNDSFSFHNILHRFLAQIYSEGLKHAHLWNTLQVITTTHFQKDLPSIAVMLQVVLRPIHCAQQIKREMWKRNGTMMFDQVANYCEPPYCRVFRDLDMLSTQFCFTLLPSSLSLWYLLASFGVFGCLFTNNHVAQSFPLSIINIPCPIQQLEGDDLEYATTMVTDALNFLINLITELPTSFPVSSGDTTAVAANHNLSIRLPPLIRRELIHVLATGSVTYSKLQETVTVVHDADNLSSQLMEKIVAEVSTRINPTNVNASPMYVLKKEMWAEYDPCFSRLTDSMHEKAQELRPKCLASAPISPKPYAVHPLFDQLRVNVLFDPLMVAVLTNLIYLSAKNYTSIAIYKTICMNSVLSMSDKFFPKVLQLLTLGIYETENAPAEKLELYFGAYCHRGTMRQLSMQPLETEEMVSIPSLLETLNDIYIGNDATTLGNDYHYLGWLIDQAKLRSSICASLLIDISNQTRNSVVNTRKVELNQLKAKSQQQAMQSIQSAAANFLAMMEGLSDSEDEDDTEAGHDCHDDLAGHALDTDPIADSDIGSNFSHTSRTSINNNESTPVPVDFEWTNNEQTKRSRVGSELTTDTMDIDIDEDEGLNENEQTCIVCKAQSTSGLLGMIGLCQPSTVLWPKHANNESSAENRSRLNNTLHCPAIYSKVNSSRISPVMKEKCNLRIGLCGHSMHENCFLQYFSSSARRNVYDENLMIDSSQGYFACPLCKKLCNSFFPTLKASLLVIEQLPSLQIPMQPQEQTNQDIQWLQQFQDGHWKIQLKDESEVDRIDGSTLVK
jgi:hypothetical protein